MLKWLSRATVAIALVVAIGPIAWALLTSLKQPSDYFTSPPVIVPDPPTLEHYVKLFRDFAALDFIKNSFVIAGGNTLFVMLLAIPAAHVRARYGIGKQWFSGWLLIQRLIPGILILIPLYVVFAALGLLNTYHGLILAYTVFTLPLAVWMLGSFFEAFPRELHDQAQVDGCTEFQSITRIVLPILAPGVTAVAFLVFVSAWNELLYAVVLAGSDTRPLMVFFINLLRSPSGELYGEAASAVLIGTIPAYILALSFQRYLVRGIASGAVK